MAAVAERKAWPDVLRGIRGAADWSQADLAGALGVSRTTVGRWERGDAVPLPTFRTRLAHAYREATGREVDPVPAETTTVPIAVWEAAREVVRIARDMDLPPVSLVAAVARYDAVAGGEERA